MRGIGTFSAIFSLRSADLLRSGGALPRQLRCLVRRRSMEATQGDHGQIAEPGHRCWPGALGRTPNEREHRLLDSCHGAPSYSLVAHAGTWQRLQARRDTHRLSLGSLQPARANRSTLRPSHETGSSPGQESCS